MNTNFSGASRIFPSAAKLLLTFACLLSLAGCDAGFQTMKTGEHGVVFSALPRFLGGGVHNKVIPASVKTFIFPWETLYRIDTSLQSVGWGGRGQGDNKTVEDYVETRALDGNEVGLAVTVQYSVNPEMIPYIIQKVANDDEHIRRLVAAVARADIRTHMNVLRTEDFFNAEIRQKAVNQVKDALRARFQPEGIKIEDVIYVDHRFERRIGDGPDAKIDRRYQQQIDETQALEQQTEQELKRKATVEQEKQQELAEAQAKANRRVQEAEGNKRQAVLRGDGYLEAKKNEAEQILAIGNAEVEGLRKQIEALSGPGGKALLRLALVKSLTAQHPQFVIVNSATGDKSLEINRVDTNDILHQAGLFSAMTDDTGSSNRSTPAAAKKASRAEKTTPKPATDAESDELE